LSQGPQCSALSEVVCCWESTRTVVRHIHCFCIYVASPCECKRNWHFLAYFCQLLQLEKLFHKIRHLCAKFDILRPSQSWDIVWRNNSHPPRHPAYFAIHEPQCSAPRNNSTQYLYILELYGPLRHYINLLSTFSFNTGKTTIINKHAACINTMYMYNCRHYISASLTVSKWFFIQRKVALEGAKLLSRC